MTIAAAAAIVMAAVVVMIPPAIAAPALAAAFAAPGIIAVAIVVPIVAVPAPAVAVARFIADRLTQAFDPALDLVPLAGMQAARGCKPDALLKIDGVAVEAACFAVRQAADLVQPEDRAPKLIDARLEPADLAVIVVVVAVGVPLRDREILRGSRRPDNESRNSGGGGQ
jgi:hypothetical protein